MTQNVLCIGNSHVGALRKAYDSDPDLWPDISFSFFGARGNVFADLRLGDDGVFSLGNNPNPNDLKHVMAVNGDTSISTRGFDAVVMTGLNYKWDRLAHMIAMYDIDGIRSAGAQMRLSQAAWAEIMEQFISVSLPNENHWIYTLGMPAYATLRPLPNPKILLSSSMERYQDRLDNTDGATEIFDSLFSELERRLAAKGVTMIHNPAGTSSNGLFTDLHYCKDPKNVDGELSTEEGDTSHMNETYGKLHLDVLSETLRLSQQRAAS
jgi:hypothetical protein